MTYEPSRFHVVALVVGTALCMIGCASSGEAKRPKWMAMAPGKVAIVSAGFPPAANFNALARGRSAAAAHYSRGAGSDAGAGVAAAPLRDPRMLLLGPLLPFAVLGSAIVGSVGGAVYGAAHGLQEDHAKALQQAADGALKDLRVQESLTQSVFKAATGMPYCEVHYLASQGPNAPTDEPNYSAFGKRGFDTVLELVVTDLGFTALQGTPRRVALDMAVRLRLVPTNGGPPLERKFEVGSRPRPAQEWADDDGRLLEQAFDHSYRTLTRYIVEAAFLQASAE